MEKKHAAGGEVEDKNEAENEKRFSPGLLHLLTFGAASTVANLYYSQPLLADMARDFQVSQAETGAMFALSSAAYSLGFLFLVPLCDILPKRKVVLSLMGLIVLALLLVALSPNCNFLIPALFFLGFVTIIPQILVPFAVSITPGKHRASAVGSVMSGVLIGVLLARTVSGYLNTYFGWRLVYFLAIALNLGLFFLFRRGLPDIPAGSKVTYFQLFKSMLEVWRAYPQFRYVCFRGACCFGAYFAFWTNFSFYASGAPFFFSSKIVGLFALLGIIGAVSARIAGKVIDKFASEWLFVQALSLVLFTYLLFLFAGHSVWGLIPAIALLDVGTHFGQISNQANVYRLPPELHGRMNAVYMVIWFLGGTIGSALGTWAWTCWQWSGICFCGMSLACLALLFDLRRLYLLRRTT